MTIYRVSKAAFAEDLEGTGAKIYGGRWNNAGLPCIYAAESRALCLLEYAANTQLQNMPETLCFAALQIPESSLFTADIKLLPANWRTWPHPIETRTFGSQWLHENKFLVMEIPSVIIPAEYNYLINPLHHEMRKVKITGIENYFFDVRIKSNPSLNKVITVQECDATKASCMHCCR